ncbi:MAG: FHA domain-containing protein [Bradymonadales bacterium]|nr:FHA domain-containing protein [Bradymonadales bacterium]
MSFIVLDIFDKLFGRMVGTVSRAAEAKAKRETVGKAEAKVTGAQAKMQEKALHSMDHAGPGMLKKDDKGVDSRAPAPVSHGYQPPAWEQPAAAPPVPPPAGAPQVQAGGAPQMGKAQLTCPNGHPIDPSWDVCPYCRAAVQKGVSAVQVQPAAGGGAPAKTVAIDPSALLGTAHVAKNVVGWIVAMNGQQKGQDFRLFDGRNVLGTAADCDLVVFDPYLSARHAVFLIESSKSNYILQDLDSRNGTYVNRQRIIKSELVDNDEIRFGQTDFRFKCLY